MILTEHLHHQPRVSVESTKNEEKEVRLGNDVASWQSANNKKTNINDEAAARVVVHRQPDDNRKIAENKHNDDDYDDNDDDNDDNDDDDDDDDEEDEESSDEEENASKQDWVAKRLPEIPQPRVNNQVTGSNRVNISNTNKNVYEGNVVIHQTFYNNLTASRNGDGNVAADCITNAAIPTTKITIDKDTEAATTTTAAVGPKLSNVSTNPLYPFKQDKVTSWCTTKRLIVISGVLLTGIAIISVIVYFSTSGTKKPTYVPSPPNDTSITNVPTFHDVCIVPRREWLAQSSNEDSKPLAELPARYVIIIPTRTAKCFTQSQCAPVVKDMQERDMNKLNKTDIGYNWLVGGDGLVYECRGWDVAGEHTKHFDHRSIGIGFIGISNSEVPSEAQITKGEQLLKKGVAENKIRKDYVLVGQYQCTNSTDDRAEVLYEMIEKWDNWSPTCL